MHNYRERLRAPASWWITGMVTMFTFGSIVWFGFPLWAALVTYGFLFAVTAAFLLNWGRATIEVSGAQLIATGGSSAGPVTRRDKRMRRGEADGTAVDSRPRDANAKRAQLPLADTGEIRALTVEQSSALRGPRADPRAYLLIRPYLRQAVYVEITAPDAHSPYWLLGTRHPAQLAAAIEAGRRGYSRSNPPADAAGRPAVG